MQARRPTRFDRRFVVMIFVRHAFYFPFYFCSIGVRCVVVRCCHRASQYTNTYKYIRITVCDAFTACMPACESLSLCVSVCVTNADTNLLLSSDPMLLRCLYSILCVTVVVQHTIQTCVLCEQNRERFTTKSNIHCNRVMAIKRFRYKNSPNRKICTQLSCDIKHE